ncbi:MAG: hypothetical protein ABEJ99_03115 [Candidatus Nanohaloarchaea archaeon]
MPAIDRTIKSYLKAAEVYDLETEASEDCLPETGENRYGMSQNLVSYDPVELPETWSNEAYTEDGMQVCTDGGESKGGLKIGRREVLAVLYGGIASKILLNNMGEDRSVKGDKQSRFGYGGTPVKTGQENPYTRTQSDTPNPVTAPQENGYTDTPDNPSTATEPLDPHSTEKGTNNLEPTETPTQEPVPRQTTTGTPSTPGETDIDSPTETSVKSEAETGYGLHQGYGEYGYGGVK